MCMACKKTCLSCDVTFCRVVPCRVISCRMPKLVSSSSVILCHVPTLLLCYVETHMCISLLRQFIGLWNAAQQATMCDKMMCTVMALHVQDCAGSGVLLRALADTKQQADHTCSSLGAFAAVKYQVIAACILQLQAIKCNTVHCCMPTCCSQA